MKNAAFRILVGRLLPWPRAGHSENNPNDTKRRPGHTRILRPVPMTVSCLFSASGSWLCGQFDP
jgi:hypothetical protein